MDERVKEFNDKYLLLVHLPLNLEDINKLTKEEVEILVREIKNKQQK